MVTCREGDLQGWRLVQAAKMSSLGESLYRPHRACSFQEGGDEMPKPSPSSETVEGCFHARDPSGHPASLPSSVGEQRYSANRLVYRDLLEQGGSPAQADGRITGHM